MTIYNYEKNILLLILIVATISVLTYVDIASEKPGRKSRNEVSVIETKGGCEEFYGGECLYGMVQCAAAGNPKKNCPNFELGYDPVSFRSESLCEDYVSGAECKTNDEGLWVFLETTRLH